MNTGLNAFKNVHLRKAFFMQTKEIKIVVCEYQNINQLSKNDRDLIMKAREFASKAYAPYSGFKVGAALLLSDGKIVSGSNQENASSPEGLCAERTALFWANANYPDIPVVAIAMSAIDQSGNQAGSISPCGACRQALLETESRYDQPIRAILDGATKIEVLNDVKSLLPLGFNGTSLIS